MTTGPLKQTILQGDCFSVPVKSPRAFGPPMWFTLHNGAASYPHHPSAEQMTLMKHFIQGLPLMIPCVVCKMHFQAAIDRVNLNKMVESKETLFSFFVDVHNAVNKRLGKLPMTLAQAKKLYAFYGERGHVLIQITEAKD